MKTSTKKTTGTVSKVPAQKKTEAQYTDLVIAANALEVNSEARLDQAADKVRALNAMTKVITDDFKPSVDAVTAAAKVVRDQMNGHLKRIGEADQFLRVRMDNFMTANKAISVGGVIRIPGEKAVLYDINKLISAVRQNKKLSSVFSVNMTKAKGFMQAGIDLPGMELVDTHSMRIYNKKEE